MRRSHCFDNGASNSMFWETFEKLDLDAGDATWLHQSCCCNHCVNHWGIDLCECGSGAREKPDKGKLLIVEDIDGAYDLVYSTKSKPWEELSEKNHYMRWAYVEDLIP